MNDTEKKKEKDDVTGMMIGGIIVTGIGLLFLLANLGILPSMEDSWPVIMIIVGVAIMVGAFTKKRNIEK